MKKSMNSLSNVLILMSFCVFLASCDGGGGGSGGYISYDVSSNVENTTYPDVDYPVADTKQIACYNDQFQLIVCPVEGGAFYGQDAQQSGRQPSYTDNGDGTVTDNITGLMWRQSPDRNGDGVINAEDKLTYDEASASASNMTLAGYSDWRLPTIKELYSLILFSGKDPSGAGSISPTSLVPFIDASYFEFAYGDENAGERIIDSQWCSSTLYAANTGGYEDLVFGVNFADGRIKGYWISNENGMEKTFYVIYVRGNATYGANQLSDNGDGTITDDATGFMWSRGDSGTGLDWEEALAWVQERNNENYLGYSDWRLPNAKELQSIVDYSRSPDSTGSAAIDPMFNVTSITNEGGELDYPFYWTSTTHVSAGLISGANAAYIAFGRALGYMNGAWMDVHGAGAQRSDPKFGDSSDYPLGNGPQGDAVRIYNYVRMVRDVDLDEETTSD